MLEAVAGEKSLDLRAPDAVLYVLVVLLIFFFFFTHIHIDILVAHIIHNCRI